ncbi:MAG: hypothetical protein AAF846_12770 [Chloroflexota bacterium]
MVQQFPILRVTICVEGRNIHPVQLQQGKINRFHYTMDGKVKRAGHIRFHYGWFNGKLTRVGNVYISYGFFGNVTSISGDDPEVEVVVAPKHYPFPNRRDDNDKR